ncbi:hypothetical protein [Leeuwenhoekiella marinoflava]|uniref:Uncharacterized protein n=2 Tax=Leeuwenhoekiella marinoflava TaxID=988 RepID=A0A4Q0PQ84_9FLAO|nr:hypothetical protein [Leeuwenhoekiella marinoflava]RXG32701.1 hypothetical protein DSL99_477 [Leeuwenhoekiella marinoflava]SHE53958.1 hypothetical protein SAMN02745246_00536 [Leeuwenhoekiella marinoflava DSM 3653]
MKTLNYNLLFKGVLFDLIGMLSMAIPVVGPFLDLAWAPYAAKQMGEMYPGRNGKIASIIVFIEEILPFTDIIPSFTLMWIYTYLMSSQPERNTRVIPIRIND